MSYFERYKKRATKNGVTQSELMRNQSKDYLERTFSHVVGCVKVLVNETRETEMVIKSLADDLEQVAIAKPSEKVNIGDYLRFNDRLWLVKSLNLDQLSPICRVLYCNQALNASWFKSPIPCHANNTTYGSKGVIDNGSKFLELDAKTKLYIQKNEETDLLYLGFRFIFNNRYVYRVTEVENTIYHGIYVVTCQMDEANDMDDFENNLAYNRKIVKPPNKEPDQEPGTDFPPVVSPSSPPTLVGDQMIRTRQSAVCRLENGLALNWSVDDESLVSLFSLSPNEVQLTASKKTGWVTLTCHLDPDSLEPNSPQTLTQEILIC